MAKDNTNKIIIAVIILLIVWYGFQHNWFHAFSFAIDSGVMETASESALAGGTGGLA